MTTVSHTSGLCRPTLLTIIEDSCRAVTPASAHPRRYFTVAKELLTDPPLATQPPAFATRANEGHTTKDSATISHSVAAKTAASILRSAAFHLSRGQDSEHSPKMLSLHFASCQESQHGGASKQAAVKKVDRAAWMDWVKRSRRSQTDLILDQECIDPRIEQHMMLSRTMTSSTAASTAASTATTTKEIIMDESKSYVPSHSYLPSTAWRQEPTAQVVVNKTKTSQKYNDSMGTEKPIERPRAKRKAATRQPSNGDDALLAAPAGVPHDVPSSPELVRVTTSMVLNDQESIWKRIQLMRQAHLPPPANHQKRRFIQDDTLDQSSTTADVAAEYGYGWGSSKLGERETTTSSTAVPEVDKNHGQSLPSSRRTTEETSSCCPVCGASARLPAAADYVDGDEAIFHCQVCGAFASSELMRSLAQNINESAVGTK
jgi:hypothetical protein